VAALALNEGEFAARLREAGVPVTVESESGKGFPALVAGVRRHARDADLLHAHRYKEDVLAMLSGRPWISTQHGLPESFSGLAALRSRGLLGLDLCAKRLSARRVIAVSGDVAAWLSPRVGSRRLVIASNGIADPSARIGLTPWSERPLRVGVAARLAPVKAIDLAIDVVAACTHVELEILGDGPERDQLVRRALASGAGDRIRFLGFQRDPLPRIAQWRALLVTSLHEANPVSVLEALALGTPVFSADLAGVAEILAGRGGWIVPGRDPVRWAQRLEDALTGPGGSAVSAGGRQRYLEAFSAAGAAERMEAIYREAVTAN
jgi:glycosyltransferase involved in cell wall biosynthesis